MFNRSHRETISTGLALFSMFFGAGNVVFPLLLGLQTFDGIYTSIPGFIITGVFVPFFGLTTLFYFDGDYKDFFGRLGTVSAFVLISLVIALIGPFGALPRCIALTFASSKAIFPGLNVYIYSAMACGVIYFFSYRESQIIHILGDYLTPALLGLLTLIIVVGVINPPDSEMIQSLSWNSFWEGIREGYQTMDLLGAFFFSSVVMTSLVVVHKKLEDGAKSFQRLSLEASLIAGCLLALVYGFFCYLSALFAEKLAAVPSDEILGYLALQTLGSAGGIVTTLAIILACLTTAIALSAVSAHFIQVDLLQNRINYKTALVITIIISYFISTLEFSGIAVMLTPILEVCYPAFIMLTIMNFAHKKWGVEMVKLPVFLVLVVSLGLRVWFSVS